MNLKQLKETVDKTIELLQSHQSPEEIPVLITINNNSVGARGSCETKYVGMGFDWEHGQFRIEPSANLVKLADSLTDIKVPIQKEFGGRKYYTCVRCECRTSKDDRYCRQCGQKLR